MLIHSWPATAAMVPVAPVAPVAPAASGTGAGLWIAGSIIGIAAFLGIYDFGRRTTCDGDVLKLGGPGYDRPVLPTDNVRPPPKCKVAKRP